MTSISPSIRSLGAFVRYVLRGTHRISGLVFVQCRLQRDDPPRELLKADVLGLICCAVISDDVYGASLVQGRTSTSMSAGHESDVESMMASVSWFAISRQQA